MNTITSSEGVVALMSHPFTWFVLFLVYGGTALVVWLDRYPRRPRPNQYMKPWRDRRPGDLSGGGRP